MRKRIKTTADPICSSSGGRNTRLESRETANTFIAVSQQSNKDYVWTIVLGQREKVSRTLFESLYRPLGFVEL